MRTDRDLASAPRWSGAPGRMEVWYATLTDPGTGSGIWIHHEVVAPTRERGGEPFGHGWVAVFPADGPPTCGRFGPEPLAPKGGAWFEGAGTLARWGEWKGSAEGISWDLRWDDATPPMWTFPKLAWQRELLPAAQVVPAPVARFSGEVEADGSSLHLDGATGGVAHIYGHGSAARWGWIHADLGGGDLLEVVTAVSRRGGLNRLPPLAFIRFRTGDRDWPRGPSIRVRTHLALPDWWLEGRIGSRRVRIAVSQPADRCVALLYTDPDGATAVCTNTERADLEVEVSRRQGGRWVVERSWDVRGTAHAEVGLRGEHAPEPDERRTRG